LGIWDAFRDDLFSARVASLVVDKSGIMRSHWTRDNQGRSAYILEKKKTGMGEKK